MSRKTPSRPPSMPSLSVDLPAYTVAKKRKSGWAFYFQVPARLRPKDFPPTHRLPIKSEERTGLADAAEIAAVTRDAKALRARLDAETKDKMPASPIIPGSIPWLVSTLEEDADDDFGWHTLAPRTQNEYRRYFRQLVAWSDEARKTTGYHPHITLLDGPTCREFLRLYKETPRQREMVINAINTLFGVAIAVGEAKPTDNPLNPNQKMRKARRRRVKKTAAQVLWAPELQRGFFDKCREEGEWGLLLALGFIRWQAQRVEDAIHLHTGWIDGDWFSFTQSKTGKTMRVPIFSEMRLLLEEVGRETGVSRIGCLAVSPGGSVYFNPDHTAPNRNFNRAFDRIRKKLGPEYAALQAQHLRHTRIIEMARAGLDLHQIRTQTGHSYKTIMTIIEHYLPEDEQIALSASLALEKYRDEMASDGEA